MSRDEVLASLRRILPEVRDRFHVESLWIFGSVARGEASAGSDADVLVAFRAGAPVTLFTLAALARQLEESLGRPVDLVEDHPRLRPAFRRAIDRDLCRVA